MVQEHVKSSTIANNEFLNAMMNSISDIEKGNIWNEDELIKEELRTMPWLAE